MKKYGIFNEQRKLKAESHDDDMHAMYSDDIAYSVAHSTVYRLSEFENGPGSPEITMFKGTSDAAARKFGGCVLNFASYKHPGGGFIGGAMAQEEALCHASDLYEVIGDAKFKKEYAYNLNNMHGALYENWAIWSPKIVFDNGETAKYANVITCPSPNLGAYLKNQGKTPENYYENIYGERVKFILGVANDNNEKILIAGAFGCGVFKNDPSLAAEQWKLNIGNHAGNIEKIVFAIPDDANFAAFNNVICKN